MRALLESVARYIEGSPVNRFLDMRTNSRVAPGSQSYLLAVAAVAACTFTAAFFASFSREVPFLAFLPAVCFSLWIGGFRPAVFSSILSALAIDLFVSPPLFNLDLSWHNFAKEIFFVATTAGAAWFFDRYRRRSDRSLRLQFKLLETAVESILITNSQHQVVFWSRGAERLYGWKETESIGQLPQTLLQTSYPEPQENIERQLKETGRWHGRLFRKARDGASVVTESSWALDEETGCILQTDLDVTAISMAEKELKRVNRALSALSRVNQVLIHASSEDQLLQFAVEIMVQEGGYPLAWIAFPNDDLTRTVKVGPSAGVAVEYLSKIDVTWADEPLGRGACGKALRTGGTCVAHNFLTDEDHVPWRELAQLHGLHSIISLPLIVRGTTRAALNVYATEANAFEDQEFNLISELAGDLAYGLTAIRLREQAEEERESRLVVEEQLRQSQKMEAIGTLAGGIAHDFNNLLMIIMAQTELLSTQVTGTARARTESIMKSAQRAAELTRQLLAFSRKQIVQLRVLSLNPILTDIARMAAPLLGENIEITAALCPKPWLVKIDRSQFEQVTMNLLVNARDAMPNGGHLTLESANADLTTEYLTTHPFVPPGKYVMMAVSDSGVGMDDQTKARLFEPFFTTKEPGKGTGLGLSMVYGIVKQSNGFIWVYSEIGKGTCFKIYIPAVEVPESDDDSSTLQEPVPVARQTTILLVEDEHPLRSVIAEFLRSAGHNVIAAQSHDEALELASRHGPGIDLLLTDVVLKGPDGRQLALCLRNKGFTFNVIYMSGYTPNAIFHHSELDGATMFLQKPFTRLTLLSKIHETLAIKD